MTKPKTGSWGLWLSLLAVIVLAVGLGILLLRARVPITQPAVMSEAAVPSRAAVAIAVPPARATPAPALPLPRRTPDLVPAPDQSLVALTPAPEGVGWISDLNGRMQVAPPGIHVGVLGGYVYQGALQFDLAAVPEDASIVQAALELTGLDATRMGADTTWRLELLPPAADADWAALSDDDFRTFLGQGLVAVTLAAAEMRPGKVISFPFDPALLRAVQARGAGKLTFRLSGPASGMDNLLTWDSGYRLREDLDTKPALILALAPAASSFVIVTSTPTPENVVTVAALALRATEVARTIGTYTPIPRQWVTPVVVTPRPVPANAATATFAAAIATAEAFLYGPATPMPPNVWTATPSPQAVTGPAAERMTTPGATPSPTNTPTPVFVLLQGQLPPLSATRTPTPAAPPMPRVLIGKIAFLSDRATLAADPDMPALANPLVYVINPDGTGLALLTARWPYEQALKRDAFSADQQYRAFVKDVEREDGRLPAVFYYDYLYKAERMVTTFGSGIAYDPVWSPVADRLALVSNDSGNDEIWVINRDGSGARQLTQDPHHWWDKRPSWSPDGRQIVFWSNRAGRRQIWIMDADGRNLRTLSLTGYNDWDPVWIKYE